MPRYNKKIEPHCKPWDVFDHWEGITSGAKLPCFSSPHCICPYLDEFGHCDYDFTKEAWEEYLTIKFWELLTE